MHLTNYNNCIYCNSKNLKKEKEQSIPQNFYLKAIIKDLKLTKKIIKKMNVYECQNCKILQNNPWFSENTSRKIYSNIYGQHNRSWSNLINFLSKKKLPDHGSLFNILNREINIKNYAEYNAPFMGFFLNFFSNEYKQNSNFYSKIFLNIIKYLTSRQLAGKSKNFQLKNSVKGEFFLNQIDKLKTKNLLKKKINKYLFIDNSSLCWGQNDNYKSVNSRSFASELLDLKILDLNNQNKKNKLDLFGIFHTLDHTFQPQKILNYALDVSRYVVVYCHINKNLEKQHLFSLTKNFLKYLNKNKIFTINLTEKINKSYKVPELYFLCSKKKITLKSLKNNKI